MIEVEAQSKLKQSQYDMAQKMCPVFGKKCIGKKCMSYYVGKAHHAYNNPSQVQLIKEYPDSWHVFPAYCMSPLVTGIITTEEA